MRIQQRTTRRKRSTSAANDNILVQVKQEYSDNLLDLYSYQNRLRSLCYPYIKVYAIIDKVHLDYVHEQC